MSRFPTLPEPANSSPSSSPRCKWPSGPRLPTARPAAPQAPLLLGDGERARAVQPIFGELSCTESQGEDCLVLNVWAPADRSSLAPVMVWIHGGAHSIGSGALGIYDGAWLARHERVVVVTINHPAHVAGRGDQPPRGCDRRSPASAPVRSTSVLFAAGPAGGRRCSMREAPGGNCDGTSDGQGRHHHRRGARPRRGRGRVVRP
ncbi:MAG: carboxylesterase family protein [Acidimicrobiia bacterium]